ncbi:MAG TPA: aldo/keto reductase [Polyangiales bacterium]|jgi:diketogulonate reductase-like aldo/keto reductase|nr:aldo/keto reductase [Polyangiales bacterium]
MTSRPFGSSGVSVPVFGQGTWQMEGDDRRGAIAALRAGIDLGLTHIDTAELYGSGRVEEMVAEAIDGRRDDLFLVSKVMPSHATRAGTIRACEQSLKRLRTDRLDCYLLHWPGSHPLEETIGAFEALREGGKIRAWGVSNFDARELERALAIAGPGKITCNQVLYHLAQRDIENEVIPWCEKQNVAVVGYTPFGRSSFPPRGDGGKVLEQVAKRRNASTRQVALAFLTRLPSLFGIPKASNAEHVRDNAAAQNLTLDANDIAEIDAAFPRPRRRSGIPML